MKNSEVDSGKRAGILTALAERMTALERETHELRKVSAYFAMTEFDRWSK